MLADFFTKPLQGGLFRKFRDVLLGHKHFSTLRSQPPAVPEERVEDLSSPTGTSELKNQETRKAATWANVVSRGIKRAHD